MNLERPRPVVLRPGEGRTIGLGTFSMSLKADGSTTAGAFSVLEAAEPADFGPPMHIHEDCAEAFYVLEGEYRIFIDDEAWSCPAGSFIFIPAGTRHGFRVGAVTSRKLNLYTPAAMVGYFDDLSRVIESDSADPDRLDDIARTHHMVIVGPVPEGYI